MTRFLLPRRSTEHRTAGIALFRALLGQASSVPISHDRTIALQNIIRNRFKKNQHVQSSNLLKFAFHAGYEALDLLDASAAGDVESTHRIQDYISRAPSYLTKPPRTRDSKSKPTPPFDVVCRPADSKALDFFPRKTVEGTRKVPTLVNSNGIPFLRYGKMPANLSRVVRQKKEARVRSREMAVALKEIHWLAETEDRWDNILRNQFPREANFLPPSRPRWVDPLNQAANIIQDTFIRRSKTNAELAKRMQEIVEAEEKLAKEEEEARQVVLQRGNAPPPADGAFNQTKREAEDVESRPSSLKAL